LRGACGNNRPGFAATEGSATSRARASRPKTSEFSQKVLKTAVPEHAIKAPTKPTTFGGEGKMSDQLLTEASGRVLPADLRDIAMRWTQFTSSMRRWAENERARRYLATLDDYLLDDIGLTREQLVGDAGKRPWE
jgi:uncharacterized protein YjiS (DUF1127 family)